MRLLQPDFKPLLSEFQRERASVRVLLLVSPT